MYSSQKITVAIFWDMLFYFPKDLAPSFLHTSPTPICYSHHFRGALILYWFWIASNMATRGVRLFSLHERWFITSWIQASSFASSRKLDSIGFLSLALILQPTPYSFLLLVLKTETYCSIHPPTNLSIFLCALNVSFISLCASVGIFLQFLIRKACLGLQTYPHAFLLNFVTNLCCLNFLFEKVFSHDINA